MIMMVKVKVTWYSFGLIMIVMVKVRYLIFIWFTNIVRSAPSLVASVTAVSTTIADT